MPEPLIGETITDIDGYDAGAGGGSDRRRAARAQRRRGRVERVAGGGVASAQLEEDGGLPSEPGDPALPARFGLRAGLRQGFLTLRAGTGLGVVDAKTLGMPALLLALLLRLDPEGHEPRLGFLLRVMVEIDRE